MGTSGYDDPVLPDVPVIASNVADLAAALTDGQLGGFDEARCTIAPPHASLAQVGDVLVQAASEAEDLLLFYYSGHGLLGPRRRELYLSLAATQHDRLAFTALAFDAVRDAWLESRATSRVVILDSCFSGRAIGETLADDDQAVIGQLQVSGTYTLTSSPANRTALILPGERHTAFTERLLNLLHNGSPYAGELLSLGDIYRHLHIQLRAEGLPVPQQRGTETADLLGLVRNRRAATVRSEGQDPAADIDPVSAAKARLREHEMAARSIGDAGDLAEAARLFRELVAERERLDGPETHATFEARLRHAFYTGKSGDVAHAMALLNQLLDDLTRVAGPDHAHTLIARRYIVVFMSSRDASRALDLVNELLPDLTRALGPDHPETLIARRLQAWNLGRIADTARATRLYQELIPDLTRILGAEDMQTKWAVEDAAKLGAR